jgi:nucleotide-binding universal stress UspA family protein
MFDRILACLDGSQMAEEILPMARAIAAAMHAELAFIRVVGDADELAAEENYLRQLAREYGAELRFVFSDDIPGAIMAELAKEPRSVAALTSHGRTAFLEALMGSVASTVIRASHRPVLVFRPSGKNQRSQEQIKSVAVALDGGAFAEQILPYAIQLAQSLKARLLLVQALPIQSPIPPGPDQETIVMLESSYLRRKAAAIEQESDIGVDWEVLHGEAASAITEFLKNRSDTILAMTSHANSALKRTIVGSVAAACLRDAGIPMLIYWPAT